VVTIPVLVESELNAETGRSDDVSVQRPDLGAVEVRLSNARSTVAARPVLRPVQLPAHSSHRTSGDPQPDTGLRSSTGQVGLGPKSRAGFTPSGAPVQKKCGALIYEYPITPPPTAFDTHSSHHRHFVEDPCCNAHYYCSSSWLAV